MNAPSRSGPRTRIEHISFPLLALSTLVLLTGCGTEAASGPTAAIRDSAGVTIVQNRPGMAADGGGWRLANEPGVVIGSFDGAEESQLFRVRGAVRLPDGRIAVANEGSQEIRLFGPDGTHLVNLGGEGEGPGEFESLTALGVFGDSLAVLDRRLRRVSVVHPDHGFVRAATVDDSVAAYPIRAWFLNTGSFVVEGISGLDSGRIEDGFQRSPAPFRATNLEGAFSADFGELPGAEQVTTTLSTDHGMAAMVRFVPFGKSPQVAAAGDRMYFGSQDSYEIRVFRSDGALERLVRLDRPQLPVTDRDMEAFIQEELEGVDPADQPARRRSTEELPRTDFHPAHGSLMADLAGYLFVEDFRTPGMERVPVQVFDPEGRLVGRFDLPTDLDILEIGEDYLLARYQDELEVEYIHLYALTRPT